MKFLLSLFIFCLITLASIAYAGTIQYIGTGKSSPEIKVTFSRNNGSTWQEASVKPGQTVSVPRDATHLNISGVPRDPKQNHKIKDGNVF